MVIKLLISGIISTVVTVISILMIAWALEEIIFFSLFIGIPGGIIIGMLTFILTLHFLSD